MNSSRCSSAALALAVLVLVAVAPVAAVDTAPDAVPEESRVGTDATATVGLSDLYSDYDSWTLQGETELTNVTWTLVEFNAADDQIDQQSYNGQTFDHPVDIESDTTRVEVRVEGTTPALVDPSYSPPQNFTVARFTQVRQGGASQAIASYGVHHYTDDSAAARTAIEAAADVVDGSGSDRAQSLLSDAIDAFEDGSFGAAEDLAGEAESQAEQARQDRETTRTLLYGGLALVVLVLVAGGIYYWRSRQDDYDVLR